MSRGIKVINRSVGERRDRKITREGSGPGPGSADAFPSVTIGRYGLGCPSHPMNYVGSYTRLWPQRNVRPWFIPVVLVSSARADIAFNRKQPPPPGRALHPTLHIFIIEMNRTWNYAAAFAHYNRLFSSNDRPETSNFVHIGFTHSRSLFRTP